MFPRLKPDVAELRQLRASSGFTAPSGVGVQSQGALSSMASANQGNGNRTDDPNGPHHALWVQMSTIGEAATRRCAELANRRGVGFVDAPVLGTRQVAEKSELVILESGPEGAKEHPDMDYSATYLTSTPK